MTAKAKGKTDVALMAAVEDWYIPIKKNAKADVEGRPPRIPPTALPFFSDTIVITVTQRLPTTNDKARWVSSWVSIMGFTVQAFGFINF